jgi:hypothetical protein
MTEQESIILYRVTNIRRHIQYDMKQKAVSAIPLILKCETR